MEAAKGSGVENDVGAQLPPCLFQREHCLLTRNSISANPATRRSNATPQDLRRDGQRSSPVAGWPAIKHGSAKAAAAQFMHWLRLNPAPAPSVDAQVAPVCAPFPSIDQPAYPPEASPLVSEQRAERIRWHKPEGARSGRTSICAI